MPGCFQTLDLTPNRIEKARQRMAAGAGYIDLTSSNPTHQGWLFPADVLRQAADEFWSSRRYNPDPRGHEPARKAIAQFYAARMAQASNDTRSLLQPDAIFITSSTSEAYSLLFALLTDPGDNILAPDVTYPLFDYLAEIHRIELRFYHLAESPTWSLNEPSLLAEADARTRGVLLVSPHNPTGMVIQTAIPALNALGIPLICDEVFSAFPYRVSDVPVMASLHPELAVFHLNGISKLFALPDLKLGWIALNQQAQTLYGERLELLNDTFLGANMLTQAMLPQIFAHGMDFVQAMAAHVRKNLDFALRRFDACPSLHICPPDGGYYLFPAVEGWDDEEELIISLLAQGVFVHPGFFYGDVEGTHVMISALTKHDVFVQGIERLCNALDE
jgi:alanine-synthesizing transaminase